MAAFNKFHQFVEDLHHKVHHFGTDSFKVALCNAANPPNASDAVLGDLTVIDYTNIVSLDVALISSGQTGGTYKFIPADKVIAASGGAAEAFRYVVFYNDTPTTPLKPLIGYYDRGSEITLGDGEQTTVDLGPNGLFSDT